METREKNYEEYIESYLTTKGGYIKDSGIGFDRQSGFITADIFNFIKVTQPKEWKRVSEILGNQAEAYFLERMKKNIDENGLIFVLRNGVKLYGVTIKLIAFKPESNLNIELIKMYEQNICKIVRQLHYSYQNNNSLDTVLFVNGFPLVTIELKNEFTGQSYEDAIKQYKYNRNPNEIIFKFNKRSLVHFAVDLQEAYMTTRLDGQSTRFLPFNQGSNGAGNVGEKVIHIMKQDF